MSNISIDSKTKGAEELMAIAEAMTRQAEVMAGAMNGEGVGGPAKVSEGIVSQIGTKSLNIVTSSIRTNEIGQPREIAGIAEIDEPDSKEAKEADLEQLLAYLTLEQSEKQAKSTEERLKSLLAKMQSDKDNVLNRLKNMMTLAMEQAEKQRKAGILGWIMTALSVVVTIAASIATFGAATPLAIVGLGCAFLGATMSVTMQALNSSGKMQEMLRDRAREMQKDDPKLSYNEAMAKAQNECTIITTTISIVLAVGAISCGIANLAKGGAAAAATAGSKAADTTSKGVLAAIKEFLKSAKVQLVAKGTQTGGGIVSTGLGVAGTVFNFKNIETAKEVAERQALLLEAQKVIDETEEALEKDENVLKALLSQIQDCYDAIGDLLGRNSDMMASIMQNLNKGV